MSATMKRTGPGCGLAIARGVGLFAALGGVLAGVAATLDWPVVGTFFGVVEGAAVGAWFGAVAALVLTALARLTSSSWAARIASVVLAGALAILAAAAYAGPIHAPRPVTAALIGVAALGAGVFGPLIARGMERAPGGRALGELGRQAARFLVWGAAGGGGVGAAAGVVIGIHAYLPTAGFAAVEGAALGAASGSLLACLAAVAFLVPRVCVRR